MTRTPGAPDSGIPLPVDLSFRLRRAGAGETPDLDLTYLGPGGDYGASRRSRAGPIAAVLIALILAGTAIYIVRPPAWLTPDAPCPGTCSPGEYETGWEGWKSPCSWSSRC